MILKQSPNATFRYPCTCLCPSNDGVQFQHTIVQHKWSNPCANGKLNPRTEGTSDHHYRIAFLFAVIIVIMHHHFQTEQYHNGNSGLFVNSIPATDCLLTPNVNLDQAPSAIHSCQFKFSTDLSPNFAYLPVRTTNWFDEVKFTSFTSQQQISLHVSYIKRQSQDTYFITMDSQSMQLSCQLIREDFWYVTLSLVGCDLTHMIWARVTYTDGI